MAAAHHSSGDGLGQRSNARRHAQEPLAGVDAASLAAAKATSRYDHAGAARHLSRAIDRLIGADEAGTTIHFELVHLLGRAQWRAGDRRAAATAFDEAWRLAEQLDDVDRRARAAIGGGFSCDFSGDAALARAERCRAALSHLPEGDSPTKARLLADLAASLVVATDPLPAQAAAVDALDMARRTGDPLAIGYALVAEQFLNQGPSRLARRIADAREIIAIAAATAEHPLDVLGRFCLIGALLEAGDPAFDAEITTQAAIVRRLREPAYRRHDLWFRCMRALLQGDTDDAETLAQAGFDAAVAASDPDALAVYGGQINVARLMQGRAAETIASYEWMWQHEPGVPLWPAVLAAVHAGIGQLDVAAGLLAELRVDAVPDDRHTLVTWSALGEAASAVGDRAMAADAYAALSPYADRMVPIAMGIACWGPVARQLGLLALAVGDVDAGVGHLEASSDLAARLQSPPWIAWSMLDLVDAELRSGRASSRTARMLTEATELASTLDLAHLVERAAVARRHLAKA